MIVDAYFDITCCRCARSWSTDFERGMARSKAVLIQEARQAGWTESGGHNPICPECRADRVKKRIRRELNG